MPTQLTYRAFAETPVAVWREGRDRPFRLVATELHVLPSGLIAIIWNGRLVMLAPKGTLVELEAK